MMILVVDRQKDRLQETAEMFRRVFPKDTVATQDDPLAAVQFVYYNPVDYVITALDMRPMDGVEYIQTAKKVNPKAKMFLLATERELNEFMVLDDEADGFLTEPLTEHGIRSVLTRDAC